MTTWLLMIAYYICTASITFILITSLLSKKSSRFLPPAPPTFPIIGNTFWLCKSFSEWEPVIRSLHAKLGPIITLHIASHPAIVISDRHVAHQALVRNRTIFATRPPPFAITKFTSSEHNITAALSGPRWRLLRRNLTSQLLQFSRVKSYSHARKWALQILVDRVVESQARSGNVFCVINHFRYAMFCLLVLMCFGDKLDEKQIGKIEEVERNMLSTIDKSSILNVWPRITRILFPKRWEELLRLRHEQENVLIPLIRARKEPLKEKSSNSKQDADSDAVTYVDTLLDLEIPNENRKLTETEIVSLCNEFLSAGTDTTSSAMEWIMANLVKHQQIQEKLYLEMRGVVKMGEQEVKEEHLRKLPYLKAVILEGLRRHPPVHWVSPHAVTDEVILNEYVIPKHATVNFLLADIGWDSAVWEEPMKFKPERFMNETDFDITGSREIKMMPFGVGRRICPGLALAMLHLQYFVGNLIWRYEWRSVDEDDDIDLSEKQEFTVVMKNPLKAHLSPRSSSTPC